ncbi:MAG: YitT family protein [Clostridia bacterium]|nr:YitT family protein [Clostridia bacterium]
MKLTKKEIFEEIKGYVFMVVGCIAYGASTALFLEPNGIVAGGVTGLAVLINLVFKTPISVGVWFIVINLPILILAIKSQGIKFILRCLITIITLGLVTDLI